MAKHKQQQYLALFFILLVSLDEFCLAKETHPRNILRPNLQTEFHRTDDVALQTREKRDTAETNELENTRDKRISIGAAIHAGSWVLFGGSILATAAGIGFEIWLKIEGCEGLFEELKKDKITYNETKNAIFETNDKIHEEWLKSEILLNYIQPSALNNEQIGFQLNRISETMDDIVEVLSMSDSQTLEAFSNSLEAEIAAGNETVIKWSEDDIQLQYDSWFNDDWGRLRFASKVLGLIGSGAYIAWYFTLAGRSKINNIQAMLHKNFGSKLINIDAAKLKKMFGTSDITSLYKSTAKAMFKSKNNYLKYSFKHQKWNWLGSYIWSGVSIGFEVWTALNKVEECRDIRDDVKSSIEEMEPEYKNMLALLEDIRDNEQNLTAVWEENIRDAIANEDVIDYLAQIKTLVDNASESDAKLVAASTEIQSFIDTIETYTVEDYEDFYLKQNLLIDALQSVRFSLSCYHDKVKVLTIVSSRCADGLNTIEALYDQAVVEFDAHRDDCLTQTGTPYTTLEAVISFVSSDSVLMDYHEDCLLNNEVTAKLICEYVCDDESDATIASNVGISVAYVSKFKALCDSLCDLTVQDKNIICSFKQLTTLEQILKDFSKYDPAQVTVAYDACV